MVELSSRTRVQQSSGQSILVSRQAKRVISGTPDALQFQNLLNLPDTPRLETGFTNEVVVWLT